MKVLIGLIFVMVLVAGLAFVGRLVLGYFTDGQADGRKSDRKALATRTKQLALAQSALSKIAADDSGNPRLDAQIALGEISATEIKELESK